jgi:hypothetical protein
LDARELGVAATYSICRCGGPLHTQRPQLMMMMASTDARMREQGNSMICMQHLALGTGRAHHCWGVGEMKTSGRPLPPFHPASDFLTGCVSAVGDSVANLGLGGSRKVQTHDKMNGFLRVAQFGTQLHFSMSQLWASLICPCRPSSTCGHEPYWISRTRAHHQHPSISSTGHLSS